MNQQPDATFGHSTEHAPTGANPLQIFGLLVIIFAFIGTGLLYDFTVPLFEKPDELKHFAVLQFIQSRHQLPLVQAGVYKPWDQEGTQPPLYHILSAAATSWLDLSSFEEPPRNPHYADDRSFVWRERGNNNLYLHPVNQMWDFSAVNLAARISRWISLLAGVATITLTFWLARIIFVNHFEPRESGKARLSNCRSIIQQSIPLLAAALLAFIPQFLHVSTAITNDALSVTIAAGVLVVLALAVKRGLSIRYAAILGIVLGLGAITKLSLLYLVLPAGLVFLYQLYRTRSLSHLLKAGAITGSVALLLSGWWFWRNWQLYGDFSALNAHLLYRGGALNPTPTLAQIWQTEMVGLELSFWAAFGAGQILVEPWIYSILRCFKFIPLFGIILGVWRMFGNPVPAAGLSSESANTAPGFFNRIKQNRANLIILAILWLWVVIIFVALLRWMQITPASWGRLLYPALPALAVLSAWGVSELAIAIVRLTQRAPRLRCTVAIALLWLGPLLLFTLAVTGAIYYTPAAYAKTAPVTENYLPRTLIPLDYYYGDERLRLIGFTVAQEAVRPGEWLPVTLFWQATQPINKNYSAFVHLLNQAGNAVAQANSYPNGGKWPTSMLEPGGVLPDTTYIFVPPDTEAPVATRLSIGIFEFDDPERAAKPALNSAGAAVEPLPEGPPLLPRQWPALQPVQPREANFGGQIRLIGTDSINEIVEPGAAVPLTLYWETISPPGKHLNLFIHLLDAATQSQIAGFDGPPHFPTGYWQPGTTLVDARVLTLPPNLPAGTYHLNIGWYELENFARLPLGDGSGDSLRLTTLTVK